MPGPGHLPVQCAHNAIVKTQWCGPSFHSSRKEKKSHQILLFFSLWGDFIVRKAYHAESEWIYDHSTFLK